MNPKNYELDEAILEELDDFDSPDFWRPRRSASHDYLDDMWGRFGFRRGASQDEDILVATDMVQSFLNSFARDGRYVATFNPHMQTAGTNLVERKVTLTPAPILDRNITPETAGRILTALAVHEISHPRYGHDTHEAAQRAYPRSASAATISNLLDDLRIENRFVEDYPGYSGIFQPALDYITDGVMTKNGGKVKLDYGDQINVATMATRYERAVDWTGMESELAWWKAWAKRWSKHDSPRKHVEAIREALRHIVTVKVKLEVEKEREAAERDAREDSDQRSDDEPVEDDDGAGSDEDMDRAEEDSEGDGDEDESIDAEGEDGEGDAPEETSEDGAQSVGDDDADSAIQQAIDGLPDDELGDAADEDPQRSKAPQCTGRGAVESAAVEQGVDQQEINDARDEAEQVIQDAKNYEDDGVGGRVDVARSTRGLPHPYSWSQRFVKSDLASRFIRDALMRSRTGHTAVAHYQKRGRLDQQAMHRLASHDFRLFDRKTKESPGRFLFWVMVDRSGSMDGMPSVQTAQVATAIADASRHVKTMRMAVWAWTDSFRNLRAGSGAAKVWQTGQPTSDIAKMADLKSGGTPDAAVLSWAHRAIRRDLKGSEQPVIIFCSDGWGSSRLGEVVNEARKAGVKVISVAIGGAIDAKSQEQRFGPNGYVTWQGDIVRTAKPLSKLIARIVSHG